MTTDAIEAAPEAPPATAAPESGSWRPDTMTAVLGVVALVAATVLVLWPAGRHVTAAGGGGARGAVAYLAMWMAMTLAMMLPTSRPLLVAVRRMGRPDTRRLQAAVVAGYLTIWAVAGAIAFGGTVAGRHLVASLTTHPVRTVRMPELSLATSSDTSAARLVTAAILLVAGLFHLSPWAASCLRKCRSPFGFLARGWHGRTPARDSLRIGLAYGRSCLGCCAAPMTAMALVGMHSLAWMAAFGLLTARQKTSAWGAQLRLVSGVGLVVAAVAVAVV